MKLRQPTDFLILEQLERRGRNVATNLSHHTGKSRQNINSRLPVLQDYGLVEKIGPADHSGVYEITSLGKAALIYQDQYNEADNFEELITETEISPADANQPDTGLVRGDHVNDGKN